MENLNKKVIVESIDKVAQSKKNWNGRVWYGSYRSYDDVQDVQYALYCEIPQSKGRFVFLEGQSSMTRSMDLYIAESPKETEVENHEPLPQSIVFSTNAEEVQAYGKERKTRRRQSVTDFEKKIKIDLEMLPKDTLTKLEHIAFSFYESYL